MGEKPLVDVILIATAQKIKASEAMVEHVAKRLPG